MLGQGLMQPETINLDCMFLFQFVSRIWLHHMLLISPFFASRLVPRLLVLNSLHSTSSHWPKLAYSSSCLLHHDDPKRAPPSTVFLLLGNGHRGNFWLLEESYGHRLIVIQRENELLYNIGTLGACYCNRAVFLNLRSWIKCMSVYSFLQLLIDS